MEGLWRIWPARNQPILHNLHLTLHYVRNRNVLFVSVILLRRQNVLTSPAETLAYPAT